MQVRFRTFQSAGVMSVAFVAVARAAREARPRPRVTCVRVPRSPLEDPALLQVTAEMPALVAPAVPEVFPPPPPMLAPEVEPAVFAPGRAITAPGPLILAPTPVVFVPEPVLPARAPEAPPARPRPPQPPEAPQPAEALQPPEAPHPPEDPELPEPEPAFFVPEPPPRFDRPLPVVPEPWFPAGPEERWGWSEPWRFEIPAPTQQTTSSPRARRRRPTTPPRARARRGALRTHPVVPVLVLALAIAVCVWVELPRVPVSQRAGPVRTGAVARARVRRLPHPSAFALRTIPSVYLHDYWQAATDYGLDWTKLAAVGQIESDQGQSQAPGVNVGTNSAGAAGLAQFVSGTWSEYAVDADRTGSISPYNPADAITTMARYLRAMGAPLDWQEALYAYNHSPVYVHEVLALSRRYLAR